MNDTDTANTEQTHNYDIAWIEMSDDFYNIVEVTFDPFLEEDSLTSKATLNVHTVYATGSATQFELRLGVDAVFDRVVCDKLKRKLTDVYAACLSRAHHSKELEGYWYDE